MALVFADLRKALPGIKRRTGGRTPFASSVFDELRLLAGRLAVLKRA